MTEMKIAKETVNDIMNVNDNAFEDYVGNSISTEKYNKLYERLGRLRHIMLMSKAHFSHVEPNVLASNVLPFLNNRTDWNNLSIVNKDIYKAVVANDTLTPPWPLRQWNTNTEYACSPAFSTDGKFIYYGDGEGKFYLWSRMKGLIKILQGPDVGVCSILSPCGNLMVSVEEEEEKIKLWDIKSNYCWGRCLQEWTQNGVENAVISPNGKTIATFGDRSNKIHLRRITDGTTVSSWTVKKIRDVVFSPDSLALAFGGQSGTIQVRSLDADNNTSSTLEGHSNGVTALEFSSGGSHLVSASLDTTIKLWEMSTKICVRTLTGHTSWVRSISFFHNGRFLASGGGDNSVRIWNVTSGHCVKVIETAGNVYNVEFEPDGQMLLSKETNNTIQLRYLDSGILN